MSRVRYNVAHDLIDRDEIIDGRAQELFGHGKPFGSRWSLEAGSFNLRPIKTLLRRVDLVERDEYKHEVLITKFLRLYTSRSPGESNAGFAAIFNGLSNVNIRARNTSNTEGYIQIIHAPDQDAPTLPTTADLGRMMLVDELLFNQGIVGSSRQVMTDIDATRLDSIIAAVLQ